MQAADRNVQPARERDELGASTRPIEGTSQGIGEKVAKKKESLHVVFIKDDNGDVTRGPAESHSEAVKRGSDAKSSSHRNVEVWTEEVK